MRKIAGVLLSIISTAWGADGTSDQIRGAAARGLARIQASQQNWFAKQSCYSCHQQILPGLAIRAAREHGVPVNEVIARADAAGTFRLLSDLDRAVQYPYIIDPALGEGYLLVAAHAAGIAPSLATAVYARHLAVRQQPEGRWISSDARPPQSYSDVTATAIVLRAIQIYGHSSLAADTQSRIRRAAGWLAARVPQGTEECTFQLYGLWWAGADRALLDRRVRELPGAQHPDGGWGALDGRASDAFSTGQALTVLHEAGGVPVTDAGWRRGIRFLLGTQAADGSWHVASRLYPPAVVSPPYFESGYPYGHDQFVSAMGASWAVRALAAALGPAGKTTIPEVTEASLKGIEPWVETVLFGSAADLRKALDQGLDPNAATRSSGTTALMLAQPDLEKTRLLLERGAKINARSKSKYSALMLASLYPGAAPVMRMLLDRGAEMRLPKGAGAPLFNASPLVLAVFAGNTEMIPRLRQAGAKLDEKMLLVGMFPTTAAATTVAFGDVAGTRALLSAGVDPNEAYDDGFTLLYLAVISNRAEVARLLIERGANVNAVDKRGMTPLLYAASADFGDASMMSLLLKMGASPAARTKEGLTALDLANKYHHSYLLASLTANR